MKVSKGTQLEQPVCEVIDHSKNNKVTKFSVSNALILPNKQNQQNHGKQHRDQQAALAFQVYIKPMQFPNGARLLSISGPDEDLMFEVDSKGRTYRVPLFYYLWNNMFDPRQVETRLERSFTLCTIKFPNRRWYELCMKLTCNALTRMETPFFEIGVSKDVQPPKPKTPAKRKAETTMPSDSMKPAKVQRISIETQRSGWTPSPERSEGQQFEQDIFNFGASHDVSAAALQPAQKKRIGVETQPSGWSPTSVKAKQRELKPKESKPKEPKAKGPQAKGPQAKEPQAKGPQAKGPQAEGPKPKGPKPKGPKSSGTKPQEPKSKGRKPEGPPKPPASTPSTAACGTQSKRAKRKAKQEKRRRQRQSKRARKAAANTTLKKGK